MGNIYQVKYGLCLLALSAVISVVQAENVALASGETLDWLANTPAAGAVVQATGGTVSFTGDAQVDNVFELSGPVTADIASGATVRFAKKWLKKTDDGQVVCTGPVEFGSTSADAYAYLPPESLAFTSEALAAGAQVTFKGYPSFTVLPGLWQNPVPFVYGSGTYSTLYGTNMFPVMDGKITLPTAASGKITWRASGSENFKTGVPVVVPTNVTLVLRRMTFKPETGSGSSWTDTYPQKNPTAEFTTDVELNGGTLSFLCECDMKNYGSISGAGAIDVIDSIKTRYLYGSLDGLSADSTLTLKSKNNGGPNWDHSPTRLNSSFAGHVVIKATSPTNSTSIGFVTQDGKFETNSVYRLGSLKGEGVISDDYGPRLQFNKNQKFIIGKLEGQVNIFASSVINSCDLEVDDLSDGLFRIKNGLRLKVNGSSRYPRIVYSATQLATTNTITLADGVFIDTIQLPGVGKTVYLHAGAGCSVGNVTGTGTLVVERGTVRIGRTEATAKVLVRAGTVTFGGGQDLSSLLQEKPALWLDASASENMVGVWNAGWAKSTATGGGTKVLANCPAVTFNGAQTATYTNGFPLIEKWFDKRPTQRLNYGWQDRCVDYTSTLYPLAYPYLVPNGLNGRAYMSFGEHGESDLDPNVVGLSDTTVNENHKRERRRMPFMQDMKGKDAPEGHAIYAGTIVMVFGSQQGGGRAIIGGYAGENEKTALTSANGRKDWTKSGTNPPCGYYFSRLGDDYSLTNAWLSTSTYSFFADSEQVDPKTTAPNGDWQVISLNAQGKAVRSLGMGQNFLSAGGQNYAEILIFTNALTTVERRSVEGYLAMKWNLPGGLSVKGPVEVQQGATVKGHVMNVTGEGSWLIDSPEAAPTLNGAFAGDVALSFTYADSTVSPLRTLNSATGSTKGTITVDITTQLQSGSYPLVNGTAASNFASWSLKTTGSTSGYLCSLEVKDNVLNLVVKSGGTMVIVR